MTFRTSEIEEAICERIANGETLRAICREEGMPSWRAVYNWVNEDKDFASRIARARDLGFDSIAEETVAIADDSTNDWMTTQHGKQLDAEHVQRSKLRIETRLKLLAKWCPAKYGERQALELSNPDGTLAPQNDATMAAKLAAILAAAQARKDAEDNNPGADLV